MIKKREDAIKRRNKRKKKGKKKGKGKESKGGSIRSSPFPT